MTEDDKKRAEERIAQCKINSEAYREIIDSARLHQRATDEFYGQTERLLTWASEGTPESLEKARLLIAQLAAQE